MKISLSRRIYLFFNSVILIAFCAIIVVPLWMVVLTSFSPDSVAAAEGFVLWPQGFDLGSYRRVFASHGYMTGFFNSIIVTVSATLISLALTTTMAYALAQKELVWRKMFMNAVLFTMLVSGGMVPSYLVVKNLGMIDSYTSLIIPGAISAYNLILMRNYFQSLPESLIESARLDGCTEMGVLIRIVLPISLPIIAAITLFYCVSHWNSYFDVILYINNSDRYTLQVLLRQLIFENASDAGVTVQYNNFKMAVMLLAMLPILVLYPFIQKHFISGIMLGSVKG